MTIAERVLHSSLLNDISELSRNNIVKYARPVAKKRAGLIKKLVGVELDLIVRDDYTIVKGQEFNLFNQL